MASGSITGDKPAVAVAPASPEATKSSWMPEINMKTAATAGAVLAVLGGAFLLLTSFKNLPTNIAAISDLGIAAQIGGGVLAAGGVGVLGYQYVYPKVGMPSCFGGKTAEDTKNTDEAKKGEIKKD